MEGEDPVLYVLTSLVMLAESAILWTQKLSIFGKAFLTVLIAVQALTLFGAWKDSDTLLKLSHVTFGSSIIIGSLLAHNKYILLLLASVIVASSAASLYQGRCAYYAHAEELECSPKHYFTGCIRAEMIYGAALAVIVIRYCMGNIK